MNNSDKNLSSTAVSTAKKDKGRSKFLNEEALQKAYDSLQAEFTKRCQRIKELEDDLNKLKNKPVVKGTEELSLKPDELNGFISMQDESSTQEETSKQEENSTTDVKGEKEIIKEVDDSSKNEILHGGDVTNLVGIDDVSDEIKKQIIKEYLKNVKRDDVVKIMVEGSSVKTPANKPKTLKEAGALEKQYFLSRRIN